MIATRLEKGILLNLRFGLDQYINLRPIKLFPGVETPLKDKGPADIDYVVVREGVKVLKAVAGVEGFKLEVVDYEWGGDRYLRTGEVLPPNAVAEMKKHDAIFLGAIGHPDVKPGILEKGILLELRFGLDQYINLRPVKLFPGVETPLKDKGPADIDYVVVRENSGDVYTGSGGVMMKGTAHEVATQTAVYTRHQVDRCLKYAFELTKKRKKKNTLALCVKTNVLTFLYDLPCGAASERA